MRFDAMGMFWEDKPTGKGKNKTLRPMPAIPDTGWVPPAAFPNLMNAPAISIDTETKDPNLKSSGPGWARNDGHIVGFSVGAPDGSKWYFPIRHEVEPEYNIPPEQALGWLKHTLEGNPCPKIGANLFYDIGWLKHDGIEVAGPLYDIQHAEALLNSEAPEVDLDSLSERYLGMGKETSILYQWCADYYGGKANGSQRANIYRSPPRLAGPYAEADAALPIRVMNEQWPRLQERGVMPLFDLESRLIRLLVEMRWKGAPIDVPRAEALHEQYGKDIQELQGQINQIVGFELQVGSADSMQKAFDHLSLPYGRTAAGNPSFTATVLEGIDHPLTERILEMKRKEKIRGTFIESYILSNQVNGRIHCQFHQLKGDENGARSGRFASSTPNLQNIPIRSAEGKLIRKMFADAYGRPWRKYDYSQIEYRMLAHHAVGPGAEDIRQRYINNPDIDYHDTTIELIKMLTAIELDRRPAKTINFGLIYGMSKRELIKRLKLSTKQGNELFNAYHKAVPFAKATAEACSDDAQRDGYVQTILGRRSDFPLWGPANWNPDSPALPFDQALMTYGRVARAFTHKALNRKLQGGAADVMKAAMVYAYEAGVFDATGIPLLTVHDELDFVDEGAPPDAWDELVHIMETCVPQLSVPIRADVEVGPNWGDVKELEKLAA